MSEQHHQRDQNGHEEPPHDDPLAELARIVSGEEEAKPAPAPASIQQVTQDIGVKPAPVAPMLSPPQAGAPEEIKAAVISQPEVILPNEDMDLESQLMAELGGEPDIAVPSQSQEHFAPAEQPATVSPQPKIIDEMEAETIPAARQEQAPTIDFETALEQKLMQNSDQTAADAELPAKVEEQAIEAAQDVAPVEMETEPAAVELPATAVELPTIEEPTADELDFGAAFNSELAQTHPVESVIDAGPSVMTAESAPETDSPQVPAGVGGLQSETQVEQPEPFEFQPAPDFSQPKQQIDSSVRELQNDLIDDLDIEDAFSDAFADELSLEMSAEHPGSSEQQSAPIANMDTAGLQGGELPAELPGTAAYSAYEYQQTDAQGLTTGQARGNPPEDQFFQDQMAIETVAPVTDENMAGVAGAASHELPFEDPATASGQLEMERHQPEKEFIIPPARTNSGFRMAAIALGLAIVAGMLVVGYGLIGEEENTGEPALVRADQSDYKIRPEEPGGKKIANQDQPVYDTMAGNKLSDSGQEKLITANEEPVEVISNDDTARPAKSAERLNSGDNAQPQNTAIALMQPRKVKTVTVRADGTIITSAGNQIADLSGLTSAATTPAQPVKAASVQTAADNSIDGATSTGKIPIPSTNPKQKTKTSEIALANQANNKATSNPIVIATRSLKKPDPVASTQKPAPPKTAPPKTAAIVAPEPVVTAPTSTPTSTPAPADFYVVQISSQRSVEAAEATYQNLKRRFASLLSGQPKEIREAKVEGKGTFYRVRIPIGTRKAAVNFCGRYKSAGGSCFVTK